MLNYIGSDRMLGVFFFLPDYKLTQCMFNADVDSYCYEDRAKKAGKGVGFIVEVADGVDIERVEKGVQRLECWIIADIVNKTETEEKFCIRKTMESGYLYEYDYFHSRRRNLGYVWEWENSWDERGLLAVSSVQIYMRDTLMREKAWERTW